MIFKKKQLTATVLILGLFLMSFFYLMTRKIEPGTGNIVVQERWLESINVYLATGKILMATHEVDNRYIDLNLLYTDSNQGNARQILIPLEEIGAGEDQGYPFILSLIGK